MTVDVEKLEGKVLSIPTRAEIDTPIAEHLIVELYSK
jgi:small subunit ribosomal protein S4